MICKIIFYLYVRMYVCTCIPSKGYQVISIILILFEKEKKEKKECHLADNLMTFPKPIFATKHRGGSMGEQGGFA